MLRTPKTKKLAPALAGGILALGLTLAGCSAATSDEEDAGATSSQTESPEAAAAANDADKAFVTGMIPHHEQAIEMSDIVLEKAGLDAGVAELAEQIKAAQGPEIETMNGWLEDWGVSDEGSGADHSAMGHGGGMMSADDLEALEAATADEAGVLFLEQMIVHHEGAVAMAETALEDGENADVLALAQQVIDDQTAEIAKMQEMIEQL